MSSAIDDGTKRAVANGRATIGSMLASARDDLRKVFLVFVTGFLGTFYALRIYVWDQLKTDLHSNPDINVVAVTPFDVVLLQGKIGIVVGILVSIPFLAYFGRDGLRERGWWPDPDFARWKLIPPSILAVVLFVAGVSYAYFLFFPLVLSFLASNAVNVGFEPSWSIVKWAQFIFLLTISFGLAAQLPLVMSGLTYARVVSYESFRKRWRLAIMGIFVFGAVFSPPDPITQIMWALPLIALYGFSLSLSRFVELMQRSSEEVSFRAIARSRWNHLAGVALVSYFGVYAFFLRDGIGAVNGYLNELPAKYQPGTIPTLANATGLSTELAAGLIAAGTTVVVLGAATFVFAVRELGDAEITPDPASAGDPEDIDIGELSAPAIASAPPEVFLQMEEDEATREAAMAMDDDDPEKARAILDRFDEVQEMRDDWDDAADEDAEAAGAGEGDAVGRPGDQPQEEDDDGLFTSTAAGVMDSFTEEDTTEEDIGGYYYDIAFILESLTSKAFRIVGVFMLVMGLSFAYLYRGGIGDIKDAFLARMPPSMVSQVDIVTLHPVEALIFEVKFSTILGFVATLPILLYYAWPALKERGIAGGDRRFLLVWGGTLLVGLVGGSALGFFYVAPGIISWLATDGIQSNMVIHYRVNNFGWLVIFTTVGIGLLVEVPVTMLLFHQGGLVTFQTMFERWRTVVLAIVTAAAFFTPSSLLTMLVLAVPVSLAYLIGLGLLWVYTLGGRRTPQREREAAD